MDTTTQQNWQILWQALTADVTDFNASTTQHGFEAKGTGDVTKFRRADNTWAVPVQKYKSPQQTITASGALTLAHGFTGVDPTDIDASVVLVCQTGEAGYSAGDIAVAFGFIKIDGGVNNGAQIIPDATNLNIQYGSAAGTFIIGNKTTGVAFSITNANWKAIFRARV